MVDFRIERLQLRIENAAGHEHRIHSIAMRAAAILADRLQERLATGASAPDPAAIDGLSAHPVSLNLNGMSDEQAAGGVAAAWLEAVTLRLKV